MGRARYSVPVYSPWDRLFELLQMPSYRELLVEFLSTFTFHPPRADQPPTQPQALPHPPEVSIRFTSVWCAMTQAKFEVHCGLYLQTEIDTDVVVGADTWEHVRAKGRISHVANPLYRLISTSIAARDHRREWCTSTDVFFFYRLLYKRPCAPAHGLAQYFASAHHR
ncbi:hypothetical protein Hanom_Chr07g00579781 [Helianthus anomalus]